MIVIQSINYYMLMKCIFQSDVFNQYRYDLYQKPERDRQRVRFPNRAVFYMSDMESSFSIHLVNRLSTKRQQVNRKKITSSY
jgi:hypothetical protein